LLQFLADLKAGVRHVSTPVYSHLRYDIVPGEENVIDQPDILILEGLNVLQPAGVARDASRVFVSDFFDFSIYLDAEEETIEAWYVARFLKLRETVFRQPDSYFHKFATLSDQEAIQTAKSIWRQINLANLHENILPTRERAHVILEKAPDHLMRRVRLRWV
jgi:type I pantothenate kinase